MKRPLVMMRVKACAPPFMAGENTEDSHTQPGVGAHAAIPLVFGRALLGKRGRLSGLSFSQAWNIVSREWPVPFWFSLKVLRKDS